MLIFGWEACKYAIHNKVVVVVVEAM